MIALENNVVAAEARIIAVDLPNHPLPLQFRPGRAALDNTDKFVAQCMVEPRNVSTGNLNVL